MYDLNYYAQCARNNDDRMAKNPLLTQWLSAIWSEPVTVINRNVLYNLIWGSRWNG